MPHLVSSIVLATLVVPIGLLLMAIVAQVGTEYWSNPYDIWAGGAAMNLFIIVAWVALWRKSVRWSAARIGWTALGFIIAAIGGGAAGWYVDQKFWISLGVMTGVLLTPLLWMFMTALLWRETAVERAARYQPAAVN